mmetsp:Transcript_106160/g.146931  ORF Transcript_106160/g.146931 Transcript_106160/m.146931 type:complete len:109 (-) Transcript_106160:29-355(-)|eukprot:CAMPEP_0176348140 /NCGR_PEP_ID=MMETSP0126-20121128/7631_1 /TAXON_ID=141414 ORGANISM="Strombidinopsis acuminatum, Strain SPMC142" /NCGR_SAMPLE_ID=MMETSP0126 /ASSEMBLY_ACC=CAM_ASM_000229 /LENGTH=108 /DNA_ID=CAMNT_0017696761 /DNA_START=132 /DNA_END=458 /DNA_ORIENTATION=+
MSPGEIVKAFVKEIPGTGYIWMNDDSLDDENFNVIHKYERAPPSENAMVGVPGARVYTITAANVSQVSRNFSIKLARPWEVPADSKFEDHGDTFINFVIKIADKASDL